MTTLLMATRNAHKVEEIAQILGEKFRCLALNDFPGAPVAVEDAETFVGNATRKVLSLAQWAAQNSEKVLRAVAPATAIYVVADDSGLEVDALGGAPGVHSARFAAEGEAGANAPDSANNAKLLRLLEGKQPAERTGRFRCVLAALRLDFSAASRPIQPFSADGIVFCEGVCEGSISNHPSGQGGFGYDPLFVPVGHYQSFAELGAETKNELSHRACAVAKLRDLISQ